MKGKKSLFDDFITRNRRTGKGRGRNPSLIKDRDITLIVRYFYWSEIKRKRFDDVLEALGREFFLAEQTILNVLQANNELVNEVFRQRPTIEEVTRHSKSYVVDITAEEKERYNKGVKK